MLLKIKKIFFWLINFFWIGYAKLVWAASEPGEKLKNISEAAGFNPNASQAPQNIIINIILYVLGLLGVLFLILIIVAGFQWMTAGGNEDKIAKAKERLKNAVIGFAIVIISYMITTFISQMLAQSAVQQSYGYPS